MRLTCLSVGFVYPSYRPRGEGVIRFDLASTGSVKSFAVTNELQFERCHHFVGGVGVLVLDPPFGQHIFFFRVQHGKFANFLKIAV